MFTVSTRSVSTAPQMDLDFVCVFCDQVVNRCSGCDNLFVQKLLMDFTKAVAQPECESCSGQQNVADKVHQLCCAGADGILGNGDDTCTDNIECLDTTELDCVSLPTTP